MKMHKILREALDAASGVEYELRFVVDERRDEFDRRSERWQESERGEDHVELTDFIEELANAIELGISDIEGAHE